MLEYKKNTQNVIKKKSDEEMLQQFYRAHITVNYLHKTRVYAHRKCTLTNSKNRIIDHLSYFNQPTA